MSKVVERICIVLLALGTIGHLVGTLTLFEFGTQVFVWSLSGTLAAGLVVALSILSHTRPQDRTIAGLTLSGGVLWVVVVLLFGQSVGNLLDPRVLMHALSALGICVFSLKRIRRGVLN